MAFTLTAGGTSGITVTGNPSLTGVTMREVSQVIVFQYSDGTSTTVTGSDAVDAIAAIKLLLSHCAGSDFVKG